MNNFTDNIESLYDSAKSYAQTSIEIAQLRAIDKGADLLASFVSRFLSLTALIIFSLFVSIALSLYLGDVFGKNYLGFLAVSGLYLIAYFVIILFSNSLIKTPITNLILAKILNGKVSNA